MKRFYSLPVIPHRSPGYDLLAGVHNGSLRIESLMPGAKHPDPHLIWTCQLPRESLAQLAQILLEGEQHGE